MTEFQADKNKKYKVEEIWNKAVYAKKAIISHLLGFYYVIFWKSYSKEKNNYELTLVV